MAFSNDPIARRFLPDANQYLTYWPQILRAHALERCDRDGLPACLDATSPMNKPLYERHGFEELGVIQAGSSPPMWPMQPTPR